MIRKAHYNDIPRMVELGRRVHSLSADCDIPLDEQSARLAVAGLIASGDGLVLVDEVEGKITGMLVGYVQAIWYSKKRYATAMVTYAERRGAFVWMVKRFKKWALEQKRAIEIIFDASFGGAIGEKANSVLPKLGFVQSGIAWVARGELSPAAA